MSGTGAESRAVEESLRHVDGVVFRPATLADVDALSLVAGATFLESFAGILPAEAILAHNARNNSPEQIRKYLTAPRTTAWIAGAAEGGAPVGYAMLTAPDLPLPDLTPADIELRRIYLFSRCQGGGAGQALMNLAITGARQTLPDLATTGARQPLTPAPAADARVPDAPRLLLGVYGKNLRALRFYERNGFHIIGTRQFTVGPLVCDDFILARTL